MKIKTLVILLIIMGLLAGAGALIIRQKAPEGPKGSLGAYLLEQLPVNRIASITIKGAVDTVSLVKKENRWVVKNRFNYPADFSKITDFVRKLKAVKIGREFGSSEETLKRLSLKDPDDPEAPEGEKGMRVHLKGEEGKLLASILLGKTRQTGTERSFPNGQYLLLGREPKIYLIDKHFSSLEKAPSAWLDKSLARVEAKDIKKIVFLSQDSKKVRFAFKRPEKNKNFQPLNLPADLKFEKSALNQLAGALSSLQMEDVVDVVDSSTGLESIGM
ncbi:MAG: DUF4340 domain-containing protein, partial [Desulfatiglandales bacterium]|nr:DUF4340 domain-containing protein [Desulfatiglandales bacterium]